MFNFNVFLFLHWSAMPLLTRSIEFRNNNFRNCNILQLLQVIFHWIIFISFFSFIHSYMQLLLPGSSFIFPFFRCTTTFSHSFQISCLKYIFVHFWYLLWLQEYMQYGTKQYAATKRWINTHRKTSNKQNSDRLFLSLHIIFFFVFCLLLFDFVYSTVTSFGASNVFKKWSSEREW